MRGVWGCMHVCIQDEESNNSVFFISAEEHLAVSHTHILSTTIHHLISILYFPPHPFLLLPSPHSPGTHLHFTEALLSEFPGEPGQHVARRDEAAGGAQMEVTVRRPSGLDDVLSVVQPHVSGDSGAAKL